MRHFRYIVVLVLGSQFLIPLAAQERKATSRADECINIFTDVLRQVEADLRLGVGYTVEYSGLSSACNIIMEK